MFVKTLEPKELVTMPSVIPNIISNENHHCILKTSNHSIHKTSILIEEEEEADKYSSMINRMVEQIDTEEDIPRLRESGLSSIQAARMSAQE